MRSLVFALIIAGMIGWGGVVCTKRMENISKELNSYCFEVIEAVSDEKYDIAIKKVENLIKDFKEEKTMLANFLDHTELDKIELNMEQMRAYVEEKVKTDSLSFAYSVSNMLEHIPVNYRVKIENIL